MPLTEKTVIGRWGIVNDGCFYAGTSFTRRDAIAAHVSEVWSGREGFGDISPFAFGALNEDQRRAWRLSKKSGDRAVRLPISWWE